MKWVVILLSAGIIGASCYLVFAGPGNKFTVTGTDTTATKRTADTLAVVKPIAILKPVIPGSAKRDSLVTFAKTLIGTPYLYAGTDPAKGFDCSGFINYVFNHFNVTVPRSSYDFINAGKKIPLDSCQEGDLILFTGTNPQERTIGHIGIVCETKTKWPSFIHSSSGKANSVTITSMESVFYQDRFVAAVDVLSK
jgi:cell wall-associated NlpC family hydrolase